MGLKRVLETVLDFEKIGFEIEMKRVSKTVPNFDKSLFGFKRGSNTKITNVSIWVLDGVETGFGNRTQLWKMFIGF